MNDALLWLLRHGVAAMDFQPEVRERMHLAYKGRTNEAIEEEWAAIQRYFRDCADADRDHAFKLRRAGENYLSKIRKLPRLHEEDATDGPASATQVDSEVSVLEAIFG